MNGLVIADDATGALECASLLAGLHLDAHIALSGPAPATGVCVADTESRHLPPDAAAAMLRQWLPLAGSAPIYKKTDSTLRGHIAAELAVLLESGPVVYLPAYPALGRTVADGLLLVHGVPVSETEFARDPRQPVRSAAIADLFPPPLPVHIPNANALERALRAAKSQILICDAATDADMAAFAAVLATQPVLPPIASPAGFVKNWAGLAEFPRRAPPAFPAPRDWLIVCGSLHPQSRRQAARAQTLGLDVIQTPGATTHPPDQVAAELASRARAQIAKKHPQAVLIMGGDTVRAVWRALGIERLLPLPELLPGIAACLTPAHDLLFVTKAGGFGDDRLVEQILDTFK